MRTILGLTAAALVLLLAQVVAARDPHLNVDRWTISESGNWAEVLVTMNNYLPEPIRVKVECVASRGIRQKLAMGYTYIDVPARGERSDTVNIELRGAKPDRVNCSAFY